VGLDWSFAADEEEIELQLLDPDRSRTVWVVLHGGDLYVPCAFLWVPGFKQWHEQAVRDGRAVVRIQGRLYPVQLVRVKAPIIYDRVAQRLARKYGRPRYDLSGPAGAKARPGATVSPAPDGAGQGVEAVGSAAHPAATGRSWASSLPSPSRYSGPA
jgi:hypothetical protein